MMGTIINEQLRRIVVGGDIRQETAVQFLDQLTALECLDATKPVSIYIDTYGGSVDSALSMYDAMKTAACPIYTVGIGKIMSAGVLLLAGGDKGSRWITQNARVMIHEVSAGTFGSITEMECNTKEIKRLQEIYVNLLIKETGVKKNKLLQDMKDTTYMSAKEALEYGIVDKIAPSRKVSKK